MKDLTRESEFNPTATRLLTLLNVSATKQRRKSEPDVFIPAEKLNKRKITPPKEESTPVEIAIEIDKEEELPNISYHEQHFGRNPTVFSEATRRDIDQKALNSSQVACKKLGKILSLIPESLDGSPEPKEYNILEKLSKPFKARQAKQPSEKTKFQNDLLPLLSTQRDLYCTSIPLDYKKCAREAVSLHFLDHIQRKSRRVLKNNERLAHAAKNDPDALSPDEVQDQGFTRPSVLILLPFRSAALDWFRALTSHTPSPEYQIENQARFISEYSLPPGTVDKLLSSDPGTYPRDHIDMFKGNVDDDFRIGIKITRKSVKMFSEFYGCDIILASPLGLKRSIDKEKSADYLSSIEIFIMDQTNALLMQNWDHTKTVLAHLNQLPKESGNIDFSRVKPWYLDGHAAYLRQNIILAPFETPETRSLFNSVLKNVEGKYMHEKRWTPVDVPEGIEQNYSFFDCPNAQDEPDKRFHHFTTVVLPAVLKSAVQSTNTVIFIPSSFDFIRVHNYFRKEAGVTFDILSEYSSNQDISRARQSFFTGKNAFLLISERFHFFRRYKIRGIRNLIFYGPPDHPQFYTEMLTCPFLDDEVMAADVSCRVIYSKYDWFRLERIAGTAGAAALING